MAFADQIIPGLWLGDLKSLEILLYSGPEERKEWCVVSVLRKEELGKLPVNRLPCWKFINVGDVPETNLYPSFKPTYDFISAHLKKGKQVLVHCAMGISRSATLVGSALILRFKISPEQALEIIRKKRPIIGPNSGFRKQLAYLYEQIKNNKIS